MAELPDHTSASQLACYTRCPRQYRYRYVERLPVETKPWALALGSVLHSTIGWYFEQRIAGGRPSA